jgi:LysM repeat protein
MLRTSVKTSGSRLPFFFLSFWAAISTSACSLVSKTFTISDPVPVQQAAVLPEPTIVVTVDEEIPTPAASSLPAKNSADGDPDGNEGIYHVLRRGQTLYSLSRLYQVPVERLVQANGIKDPNIIREDTSIFIPGHSGPARIETSAMGDFVWPVKGRITGRFGPRGKHSRHRGIDIDGEVGDEVIAAASGTVIQAGTRRKYGKMLVIEHSDGLSTLYAHASKVLVRVGDRIERGDLIATVGRSGNARGSHLHFEVRRNDRPVDPIPYLESGTLVESSTLVAVSSRSIEGRQGLRQLAQPRTQVVAQTVNLKFTQPTREPKRP